MHYEGEMVIVIGQRAKNVASGEAARYIFGVTAGNDVSERVWQKNDLQWVRAKSSDTFAPLGPAIVTGLDYNDLLVETRLNGEVRQSQRTRDHHLQRGHHHQLRDPIPHAAAGQSHLHRYAGHDTGDEARRRCRGRGGRRRRAAKSGRRGDVEVQAVTGLLLPLQARNQRRHPAPVFLVLGAESGGELALFERDQDEDRHHEERHHAVRVPR